MFRLSRAVRSDSEDPAPEGVGVFEEVVGCEGLVERIAEHQ